MPFGREHLRHFGLLGPNGAGKTSSIRMMMGITIPDSGRVSLFDKPFERKSLERVGYLPEERGLYKKMKVLDQLVFFGQLHGLTAGRGAQAGHRLGQAHGDRRFAAQEDRRALQGHAAEDPVHCHAAARPRAHRDGRALQRPRSGQFSTHRMDQVEKLCDSICLINNGEAVLAGKVREIKATYERNRVIVEFEGSAAFLKSEEIAEAKNFSGHAEIKLKPHGDAQKLLHEAAAVATIYRFELVEPSLEEIFIQTVGGKADA
jgi:ABC-2 type transport system ATP-binding protein